MQKKKSEIFLIVNTNSFGNRNTFSPRYNNKNFRTSKFNAIWTSIYIFCFTLLIKIKLNKLCSTNRSAIIILKARVNKRINWTFYTACSGSMVRNYTPLIGLVQYFLPHNFKGTMPGLAKVCLSCSPTIFFLCQMWV